MDNNYKYSCEKCQYFTNVRQNFINHEKSRKHILGNTEKDYLCSKCNNKFCNQSSLTRHENKCVYVNQKPNNILRIENEILKQKITKLETELETVKAELPPTNIITNSNINSNNITNINIFLNDECKHAINFVDFMTLMSIKIEELNKIKDLGFVNGVSDFLVEKMKKLSLTERPVHVVGDVEQNKNVIHIKDNDKWDDETKKASSIINNGINILEEKIETSNSNLQHKKSNSYKKVEHEIKTRSYLKTKNKVFRKEMVGNLLRSADIPSQPLLVCVAPQMPAIST
jgi:hypothetical protein